MGKVFINNRSNIYSSSYKEKIKNKDNMKDLNLNFKKDKDIKKPQFSLNKYKFKFDKENEEDIIIKKDK